MKTTLIEELYHRGLTDRQIAKEVGLNWCVVEDIRKFKLGLPSQRKRRRDELHRQIRELHSLGYSDRKIASIIGISTSSVQHHRKTLMGLKTIHVENVYENEQDRIKGYMIRNVKGSAVRRGIKFDLEYTDIPHLPEYCPLIPSLKLTYNGEEGFNNINRATIDRIDSNLGYVKGNIQVISRLANTMKNQASLDQLEEFSLNCLKLIENQRARGGITNSESLDP